jgi:hypothetical protein
VDEKVMRAFAVELTPVVAPKKARKKSAGVSRR